MLGTFKKDVLFRNKITGRELRQNLLMLDIFYISSKYRRLAIHYAEEDILGQSLSYISLS